MHSTCSLQQGSRAGETGGQIETCSIAEDVVGVRKLRNATPLRPCTQARRPNRNVTPMLLESLTLCGLIFSIIYKTSHGVCSSCLG